MGKKFLIDTNTLVDAQMSKLSLAGLQFLTTIIDEEFIVSLVTYIEFLGYKDVTQASKDFIALANVIEINLSLILVSPYAENTASNSRMQSLLQLRWFLIVQSLPIMKKILQPSAS